MGKGSILLLVTCLKLQIEAFNDQIWTQVITIKSLHGLILSHTKLVHEFYTLNS